MIIKRFSLFALSSSSFLKCGVWNQCKMLSTITRDYPDLEKIFQSGNVPEYFNFARDVFDQHVTRGASNVALWMEGEPTFHKKYNFIGVREESIRAGIALNNILDCPHSSITNPKNISYTKRPIALTILPRRSEWWFIYLGCIRNGTVFCPATTMLTSEDIAYRLDTSHCDLIITDMNNYAKVNEAEELLNEKRNRRLRKIIVGSSKWNTPSGWFSYNELIDEITDREINSFEEVETKSDEIAQIFFTSGTTGKPKMVAHSHASYGIGHWKTAKIMGLKQNDVFWNISDTGWAKSSYGNFFAPWMVGACVYIHQMEKFDPKKVLDILCNRPITGFCAPPTLYRSMTVEKNDILFRFKSLRYSAGGGEAVNPQLSKAWKERTGLKIHEIFGQTETTMIAAYSDAPQKQGSIGKISSHDLCIIDKKFNELPPGKEGTIALKLKPKKPIGLFLGYLTPTVDSDDKSGPKIDENHPNYTEDYYNLGDRAYMDEEGYLFHLGRADDVIISAGYRIGPFEVESVLEGHPAVAESAVIGSNDEQRGEVVKAYIVLTKDYLKLNKNKLTVELQDYVKLHTAPYKYPRKIEFVEELPKTISGKILRRELRAMDQKGKQN